MFWFLSTYRGVLEFFERNIRCCPLLHLKPLYLVTLLFCVALLGQDLSPIEKQRLSVRKQIRTTGPVSGFFTTSWLDAPAVNAAAPNTAANDDCDPLPEATLSKLVGEASQREGVNADLVRSLIKHESGGKPCAVSAKGAQGLMQLMPATQMDLSISDPFEAAANINGGVKYLKQMLDRYNGNIALALAAYNAGPQRVDAGGKIPAIPETESYVSSILADLKQRTATTDIARVK